MQHSSDDSAAFESAVNIYQTICRTITNKRLFGDGYERDFSLSELEELRDEAWRKIDLHTVEHIEAVEELKRELNLI
jgi:hypothetical protein